MKKILFFISLAISFALGFSLNKSNDLSSRILGGNYNDIAGDDLTLTISYTKQSEGQIQLNYKCPLNQTTKDLIKDNLLEDGTYTGTFFSYSSYQNVLSCKIDGIEECIVSSVNSDTIMCYINAHGNKTVYQCKRE